MTTDCLVCGAPADEPFVELRDVPADPNVLWASAREARAALRADVALSLCASCGLIWNVRFDARLISYTEEYENSLHFSDTFRRYSEALADRLIDRYELEGGHVAEIGSGKGEFLALLCERASCTGIGFDPSYAGESDGRAGGRVSFVRDVVGEGSDLGEPDLVVCRHVVEHLEDPVETLASVRRALGDGSAVLYVEVPSAEYLLRAGSIWDVIHPHVTCLTAAALENVLERAGFHVLEHGYSFGDEYLWVEAATVPVERRREHPANGDIARLASDFSGRVGEKRRLWDERLPGLLADQRVALWGAGAKGVTFLNIVPDGERIDAVIDVNPRKHGKYMPGAGQVIAEPAVLAQLHPGTVVVMNPEYRDEIGQSLAELGVEAAVAVA